MNASIEKEFNELFSSLTVKEKIKNKQLENQTKKLKRLLGRFSNCLNQKFNQSKKRGTNEQ